MKLSPHFTLDEFLVSQTAARKGIDNTPSDQHIGNLYRVAYTLEIVRNLAGDVPVIVSSGYRSPELNKAIGGSKTSAHMEGLAVDFIIPRWKIIDVISLIQHKVGYDQLINEFGRWVHIGLSRKPYRQQYFTIGV